MKTMTGKKALITASSRGIGRAVAEKLATAGAHVTINYVNNERAAIAAADAISKQGGKVSLVQGDMGNLADITRVFDSATSAMGGLDIVVANAGAGVFKPHAFITAEDFDRVFAVNARGTFFVLQEAARRVSDGGRIIHISSGVTAGAFPATGLYAGSKAAGERFAASLAQELGGRGVTVNTVSPGMTQTEGLTMSEEQIRMSVAMTPLGRLGEPADVADVVAFVASEEARWLTGQNLRATGGLA